MNDAEFWRLVAEFLAAQQSIPGDPSAAVGGDPSANWMDQYAYGATQGIGPSTPSDYDPMADTTVATGNRYDTNIDQGPSVWGQNAPTDVNMRTMYGLQGGLVARQNAIPDQGSADRAYNRTPMMQDLQYGLQQHQAHPMAFSNVQVSRPAPVRMATPSPAQRVVRTLTQRPVAQPVPRPAPAPVPMARPMPNAVRRSR